jgi:hypothetical protein
MDRRDVVSGGLLGVTALLGGAPSTGLRAGGDAEAAQQGDGAQVARAIDNLRALVNERIAPPFVELAEIRRQQRIFLKASHKFPEFIEIGVNVWDRLYDWQVKYQQSLNVVRRDDGRYTMTFMFTTLVLRPDQGDDYVSFAYDSR